MTNSIYLQNDLIFEAVKIEIAKGKEVRLKTRGESMMPFIKGDKDEILLKKATDSSFRKGAILLVQLSAKRFVAHRVYRVKDNMLTLRGDGNISLTEQCTCDNVLAEVIAVIRMGVIVRKDSFKWNVARYLWPSNHLLRRIILGIERKIQFIHENKRSVYNQKNRRGICHGLQ